MFYDKTDRIQKINESITNLFERSRAAAREAARSGKKEMVTGTDGQQYELGSDVSRAQPGSALYQERLKMEREAAGRLAPEPQPAAPKMTHAQRYDAAMAAARVEAPKPQPRPAGFSPNTAAGWEATMQAARTGEPVKAPAAKKEPSGFIPARSTGMRPSVTSSDVIITQPVPATPTQAQKTTAVPTGDKSTSMDKALGAIYRYGKRDAMPLADISELEGYTPEDIRNARRSVAFKPKAKTEKVPSELPAEFLTKFPPGSLGKSSYWMQESVKFLDEAGRGKRKMTKTTRRIVRKKAEETPAPAPTGQKPHDDTPLPVKPQIPLAFDTERRAFLNAAAEAKTAQARQTGVEAAIAYLSKYPRKK